MSPVAQAAQDAFDALSPKLGALIAEDTELTADNSDLTTQRAALQAKIDAIDAILHPPVAP